MVYQVGRILVYLARNIGRILEFVIVIAMVVCISVCLVLSFIR